MDILTIYQGAENLINQLIRQESTAQGHYLTGQMEDSLQMRVTKERGRDIMEGFAAYYTEYVNQGVPAQSASMKQFPFVVRYFMQRGLKEAEAKGAAAATIRTWMREGMSTQASGRFSQTGARQNFVEAALVGGGPKIDGYMSESLDFLMDEQMQMEKSEAV